MCVCVCVCVRARACVCVYACVYVCVDFLVDFKVSRPNNTVKDMKRNNYTLIYLRLWSLQFLHNLINRRIESATDFAEQHSSSFK